MSTQPAASAGSDAPRGPAPGVHPSPHRAKVNAWAMWFCIVGAPAAWALQELINVPLFAHGCYPKDIPLARPIWSNAGSVGLAVEAVAIVVCLAAAGLAWRNWRRTQGEKPGSAHQLMEAGDGRSRFMAMVGLITSGLFLLTTVVTAVFAYGALPCNG